LLVGNHRDTAALEWQFIGPTLRFHRDCAIALTGADVVAKLDDGVVPLWQTIHVRAGQVLACAAAKTGARGYIAVSGGIATASVLGSRATFHMAGIGGISGGSLKTGEQVPLGEAKPVRKLLTVVDSARPPIDPLASAGLSDSRIAAMLGPNNTWLEDNSVMMFFDSEWTVSTNSNRTGLRLSGPQFTFSPQAYAKPAEHGSEPSNILDHGYPVWGYQHCRADAYCLHQRLTEHGRIFRAFYGSALRPVASRTGQATRKIAFSTGHHGPRE
jgi:biotin-dependent carboxylase-like uncharacterized protein